MRSEQTCVTVPHHNSTGSRPADRCTEIIVLIVLLFFGGKKIPELMKSLGKGVRSFREGVKGVENDLDIKDENPAK